MVALGTFTELSALGLPELTAGMRVGGGVWGGAQGWEGEEA